MMMDIYQNFEELSLNEQEHTDFRIITRKRETRFGIFAPHGGRIEHGTSQIASAIAGEDYAYYSFEGLKAPSHDLHISSNRFDEPTALSMVCQVDVVIALHGAYGKIPYVYFGGLHEELKEAFITELRKQNFDADHDPSPTRQGKGKTNICNRGRHQRGIQIEMTQGFRKSLFTKPDYDHTQWRPNNNFDLFVETIRNVLQKNI